jgi:hypothetical protein
LMVVSRGPRPRHTTPWHPHSAFGPWRQARQSRSPLSQVVTTSRPATPTFCFSEVVRFFSMEPHVRRHACSLSRSFCSHMNMSRACYSAKRVVSIASGIETCPRAPRSGCPMMTSGSLGASSPMTAEVVAAGIWDAPTDGLDGSIRDRSCTPHRGGRIHLRHHLWDRGPVATLQLC